MGLVKTFYEHLWGKVDPNNFQFSHENECFSLEAVLTITTENINLLTDCLNSFVFEISNDSSFTLGQTYQIKRGGEHSPEKGVYFSTLEPLSQLDFETISAGNYYIGDINFDSAFQQSERPKEILALEYISRTYELIRATKDVKKSMMAFVYFGNDSLSIPILFQSEKFDNRSIRKFSSPQSSRKLENLIKWIKEEDNQNHLRVKKAIFRRVLIELLEDIEEEERFGKVLQAISSISKECTTSFDLYLEDFSYDKFSKRLEETRLVYLEKISGVVGDIKNQVLALPATFTLLALARQEGEISYFAPIGIIIYSIILLIYLHQQKTLVADIENEVNFDMKHRISTDEIANKLEHLKTTLGGKLNTQRSIIFFFQCLSAAFILASVGFLCSMI